MDKHDLNVILRLAFIFVAFAFLITFINAPKTNCDTCSFDFNGEKVDGETAWLIIEGECISYAKPWDSVYIDIDMLNVSVNDDGIQTIELINEGGQKKMATGELDLDEDIEEEEDKN